MACFEIINQQKVFLWQTCQANLTKKAKKAKLWLDVNNRIKNLSDETRVPKLKNETAEILQTINQARKKWERQKNDKAERNLYLILTVSYVCFVNISSLNNYFNLGLEYTCLIKLLIKKTDPGESSRLCAMRKQSARQWTFLLNILIMLGLSKCKTLPR